MAKKSKAAAVKQPALNNNIIKEYSILTKALSDLNNKIIERINYILKFIYPILGWWDYEDDHLDLNDDYIQLIMHKYYDAPSIILKDGSEWSISDGAIPTRWLFEDFEEEYTNAMNLYNQNVKNQIKKNKIQNKSELIKQAKAKLSKEELKALNIL